jgi:CRISPR/Cas system-associated exonuclease Cas4 (RecB family)
MTPVGELINIGTSHRYAERQKERGDKPRTLYASDYGQCPRKVWYQFFPAEFPGEDIDPRTVRIFQNGEDVHTRLAEYIRRSGVIFLEELDVPRDELNVHGRCDGVAMIKGKFTVVEFKSINLADVSEPKSEHQGQLMWYMHMWEQFRVQLREEFSIVEGLSVEEGDLKGLMGQGGRGTDALSTIEKMLLVSIAPVCGEVVYESKQTQEIFAFQVVLDQELIVKVQRWFEHVAWHVEHKKMPEVRYSRTKFPCRWSTGACQFYDVCWGK